MVGTAPRNSPRFRNCAWIRIIALLKDFRFLLKKIGYLLVTNSAIVPATSRMRNTLSLRAIMQPTMLLIQCQANYTNRIFVKYHQFFISFWIVSTKYLL